MHLSLKPFATLRIVPLLATFNHDLEEYHGCSSMPVELSCCIGFLTGSFVLGCTSYFFAFRTHFPPLGLLSSVAVIVGDFYQELWREGHQAGAVQLAHLVHQAEAGAGEEGEQADRSPAAIGRRAAACGPWG